MLELAFFLPKNLLRVPCIVWFFFMLPQASRTPGKAVPRSPCPAPE